MKKALCVTLVLSVLWAHCHALAADTSGWTERRTVFDYTLRYPSDILSWSFIPIEDAGTDIEVIAVTDEPHTRLECSLVPEDGLILWEEEGYVRDTAAGTAIDALPDTGLEASCERYLSGDGDTVLEVVLLESPVQYDECPYWWYVFTLITPKEDKNNRRDVLLKVLGTVEFTRAPAQAGSFRLSYYDENDAGLSLTDVTVDGDAEPVVLSALDRVTGVVLEKLEWDDTNGTVISAETVGQSALMEPGQAFLIRCRTSDFFPVLRVTCTNAMGQTERWYLSDSLVDGGLLLTDEEAF